MKRAKRKHTRLPAAVFLAYMSHALSIEPIADVALVGDNSRPRVIVDINGHHNLECLFDTGSTAGLVGRDIGNGAERMGLSRVITANRTIAMPLLRIRDVAIGGAHARDVAFVQRDANWFGTGGTMPCIIGLTFARNFTVDLDGPARRLRLFPARTDIRSLLAPSQRDNADIKISFGDDMLDTRVRVGDIDADSHIDTGWGMTTPNQALLDKLGYQRDDLRILKKDKMDRNSGRLVSTRTITFSSVQIGNVRAIDVMSDVDLDRDDFAIVRKQSGPYLHIGWPLLSEHRFIFDLQSHRAAFVP